VRGRTTAPEAGVLVAEFDRAKRSSWCLRGAVRTRILSLDCSRLLGGRCSQMKVRLCGGVGYAIAKTMLCIQMRALTPEVPGFELQGLLAYLARQRDDTRRGDMHSDVAPPLHCSFRQLTGIGLEQNLGASKMSLR
jgi:hypothetical protein